MAIFRNSSPELSQYTFPYNEEDETLPLEAVNIYTINLANTYSGQLDALQMVFALTNNNCSLAASESSCQKCKLTGFSSFSVGLKIFSLGCKYAGTIDESSGV